MNILYPTEVPSTWLHPLEWRKQDFLPQARAMKLAARTGVHDTAYPGKLFPGLQSLHHGQLLRQRAPTQEACLQLKFWWEVLIQTVRHFFFQSKTMANVFPRALVKNL